MTETVPGKHRGYNAGSPRVVRVLLLCHGFGEMTTPKQILEIQGTDIRWLTPSALIAAGWTLSALKAAGWTLSALIAAGWTPSDLMAAGWTPSDLMADVPLLKTPYTKILESVLRGGLEMGTWHTCETTHCVGGWTVFLTPGGKELEKKFDTRLAAELILRASRPDAPLPNFTASNEAAMAFIEARAAEEVK